MQLRHGSLAEGISVVAAQVKRRHSDGEESGPARDPGSDRAGNNWQPLCLASRASAPNRPPTSTPTTTRRQSRARASSAWVTSDAVFGGSSKGAAGIDIGAAAAVAKPRQGRHDSSINGELGTAP